MPNRLTLAQKIRFFDLLVRLIRANDCAALPLAPPSSSSAAAGVLPPPPVGAGVASSQRGGGIAFHPPPDRRELPPPSCRRRRLCLLVLAGLWRGWAVPLWFLAPQKGGGSHVVEQPTAAP